MENINTEDINKLHETDVTWHLNCPIWPSARGLWEDVVKSLIHLKRVVGEQKLTEEYTSLLQQVEAGLHSRPLYQLTENHEDDYLTPEHFLVGGSLLSRPQTDTDITNLTRRRQLVQQLNKQFWKMWSSEYVQQIQSRSKWRKPSNIQTDDVVIIKEDNLRPGKWALGRVQEVHAGNHAYARVVSLKTQNNIIKRPINKLVLLPMNEEEEQEKKQNVSVPQQAAQVQNTEQSSAPRPQRKRKVFLNALTMTLLLFMATFTPTAPQEISTMYNITNLNEQQGLYFDKISELQHIRDDWKLIVYYNMSTYGKGLVQIQNYVTHIKALCDNIGGQYNSIVLQLEHELREIEHYSKLLKYQSKRQQRGLINGVGYIANAQFGVLDDRFAEQYKQDIEKIALNENHLHNLIRNQTLIVESEFNILRRNEKVMNEQFEFIKEHLTNLSAAVDQIRIDNQNGLYITSSALAANIILSNLRRIQQTLIDTITDINHGHIDTHIFTPEQLEEQTSIIVNQLHNNLILPVNRDSLKELYKLLKAVAKVYDNYLIIEIKIPLIDNEIYELDRIISIPHRRNESMYQITTAIPFIAFNLRKDMGFLLSESDLSSCAHVLPDRMICSLDRPVYDLKIKKSICDINIASTETDNQSLCTSKLSTCTLNNNRWVKLHHPNTWLYSCCMECKVRIFCLSGMEIKALIGNGLLSLAQGCMLKGEQFTIFSHNNFLNRMNKEINTMDVPEISALNTLINTNLSNKISYPSTENHEQVWKQLESQINNLRSETSKLTVDNLHHYSAIYILVFGFLVVVAIGICYWFQKRRSCAVVPSREAGQASTRAVSESENSVQIKSVDQGTSPIVCRPVKFEVPKVIISDEM